VTRPANRPEGRGPARGYSWPPFQPGHELSTKHGARSPRKVEPLAAELVAGLLAARPDLEGYPEAVWAWGRAEARCVLLSEWIATRGLIDPETDQPMPGLKWLLSFENQAANFRAILGLDPASEARLAKERAEATRGAVGLERLRERGRAARMVAEQARRGALEAPGRPQRPDEAPGQGGGDR
jgi:hypothetical protein